MNNATQIEWADGSIQGLHFGMIAWEEFTTLAIGQQSLNNSLQMGNIIYAGAVNYALINRKPSPEYPDIIDKVEDMLMNDEYAKRLLNCIEVYHTSKFGKKVTETVDTLKKKAEENQEQSIGTTFESSPTVV